MNGLGKKSKSAKPKAPTKAVLYKQAQKLDLKGRSTMTRDQLEKAIAKAKK